MATALLEPQDGAVDLRAAGAENAGDVRLAHRQPQIGAFGQFVAVDLPERGQEEASNTGVEVVERDGFQPLRRVAQLGAEKADDRFGRRPAEW